MITHMYENEKNPTKLREAIIVHETRHLALLSIGKETLNECKSVRLDR